MMDHPIEKFIEIIKMLRHPKKGCPWDLKQTAQSLTPYILEEAYETVEAIETKSTEEIKEELGDLLLQIILQSQIASEKNAFTFDDVVEAISAKIIRRHPHVFGEVKVGSAEEVANLWIALKAKEKKAEISKEKSVFQDITSHQPALHYVLKLQKRVASLGFEFEGLKQVFDKLHEEINELEEAHQKKESEERLLEELGDVLASAINIARFMKLDPEKALRICARKYVNRFEWAYLKAQKEGYNFQDLSMNQMEDYWQKAKKEVG